MKCDSDNVVGAVSGEEEIEDGKKASYVLVVATLSNSCGITLSVWLHDRQKNRRIS
jgi:hypothetical protein